MAVTQERMEEGKIIFDNLVQYLNGIKLNFTQEELEDRYLVKFKMNSDGVTSRYFIYVNPKSQLITLRSPLDIKFGEDMLDVACRALCMINYRLMDGDFQIDVRDGEVLYNMSNRYAESEISDEVFAYMIGLSVNIVDKFKDTLRLLKRGGMQLEDLAKDLNY